MSPTIASLTIRPAADVAPETLRRRVVDAWGAETVVAHEERVYPARLPGFVAMDGKRIVGHASYRTAADRCELTSIEATPPGTGIGSRLLEAVISAAQDAGCRVLWLTTTNDNLDALRFYQRRRFRLVALRPGAVDRARAAMKPEIPLVGASGIPMRDELDLELDL